MQATTGSRGSLSPYRMFSLKEAGFKSPEPKVDQAIRQFLKIGNHDVPDAVAAKWIEMPKAVLLFQMRPDQEASGAIYVYDRKQETFYMISFEEGSDENITVEEFEALFAEYNLMRFAEQPALLHAQSQASGTA